MSWNSFLEALCNYPAYGLTALEREVILCLQETPCQTKNELLAAYVQSYAVIEEEAFTQRLKNIYKKFQIVGKGHKLPQLHQWLMAQYLDYQNQDAFFTGMGLNYIYPQFPRDAFGEAIDRLIDADHLEVRQVDILQTFAPNLNDYFDHLTRCLKHGVHVRILLAWPYSEAAKLREEVLRRYGDRGTGDDINIQDCVIANLETLEKIIEVSGCSQLMEIKLYDTLPSLAIYRAGHYLLAAPFLHGSLAINTFQLELTLNVDNPLITQTLQKDFELMWQVARRFDPAPSRNWRSDLKILFTS